MPEAGGALLEPERAAGSTAAPPGEIATLEFRCTADDLPGLTATSQRRPARLVWYDDAEGSLAAAQLSLVHDGAEWQLQRSGSQSEPMWPACCPPEPLGRAGDPAGLPTAAPDDMIPLSAFEGVRRQGRWGEVAVTLMHGSVHGIIAGRAAGRATLTGPIPALHALLASPAAQALSVPRASLAQEALTAATGAPLPPRRLGAPTLPDDPTVNDGLAAILGHLLDVLLFWTDAVQGEARVEAVHQARVATRRLRSALSIYHPVAPTLAALADDARQCGAMLGAVRDWDVFLAGTGATLRAATADDKRVDQLLRTAARQRDGAMRALTDYLAGDDFHRLELGLAAAAGLRAWEGARGAGPTPPFAATELTRRLKRARRRARAIGTLPTEALHELRKDCKRLRYAAEFFAPGFHGRAVKLFLRRLADLQEKLGLLNDAASSSRLMARLGRAGRGYAGGMADGLAAAAALPARARIVRSWKRFKRTEPFWK